MLLQLPQPNEKRIAIHVTPAAERHIRKGHPWLFADSIRKQNFNGRSGDLAVVFDKNRKFLAIGLYDPLSPIRVRILQANTSATIDQAWFQTKLETAVQQRLPLPQSNTNGYRLVHGENDSLSGLVIDRYDQTFVLKLYSVAWIPHLQNVLAALTAVSQPQTVILRLNRAMQKNKEHLYGLQDGQALIGKQPDHPVPFLENNIRFEADVVHGQKTGFFLDQRDNRAKVESLAMGKTVLNVFAYTGGFSVYAARGGATEVVSLDLSKPALQDAQRNFELNLDNANVARAKHELLAGDAFQLLKELQQAGREFDIVILDPPSFAKKQDEVEGALAAYGRLTKLGLGVLKKGGILVAASCSSRVDADTFFKTVSLAALDVKRPLSEIERTSHALDHPINFAEGAYLKCLFASA